MKLAYQDEIRKIRVSGSGELLDFVPHKKQGRPVLLGEKFDGMVKAYIRRVGETGGSVSSQVVMAAAHGILTSVDKTKKFGYNNRLDYKVPVNWFIAEHKSQGTMQLYMNRGDYEDFYYFEINNPEKVEEVIEVFDRLEKSSPKTP